MNANFNHLFRSYKRGAEKRNLSFELTEEDFAWFTKQSCVYCGEPPHQVYVRDNDYRHKPYLYTGIDRVDNGRGYERTNVVPCCRYCNMMKSNRSKHHVVMHILQLVQQALTRTFDVDLPRFVLPEERAKSAALQLVRDGAGSDSDDEPQG